MKTDSGSLPTRDAGSEFQTDGAVHQKVIASEIELLAEKRHHTWNELNVFSLEVNLCDICS